MEIKPKVVEDNITKKSNKKPEKDDQIVRPKPKEDSVKDEPEDKRIAKKSNGEGDAEEEESEDELEQSEDDDKHNKKIKKANQKPGITRKRQKSAQKHEDEKV